ncbi:hypothetical protein ADU37_CDS06960 [Thermococcus sp. 2319x1]|nr:hypothetical protein ADU37_CDS06960 [Thermococcus sp. 2319x1]
MVALLLLVAFPGVLAAKVTIWNVGGMVLHPRLSPDGLYFTDYMGRVGLKLNDTRFLFWRLPFMPNGLRCPQPHIL